MLAETYHLLDMIDDDGAPAAECIWEPRPRAARHRPRLLRARSRERVPAGTAWAELDRALRGARAGVRLRRRRCGRASAPRHVGHQLGLEILAFLPLIGTRAGFFELRLADDLAPIIPERLHDPALQEAMKKVLVPPPATRSDEIVAAMGGVYWDREAPTLPPFVEVGTPLREGPAALHHRSDEDVQQGLRALRRHRRPTCWCRTAGVVVRKGQPLFKVEPDETLVVEDPKERAARIRARTDEYLASVL